MNNKSILIIDDDNNIRKIAGIALSRIGKWHIYEANSGLNGLALAQTEIPDCILLDIMMPNISGVEIYHKLQANPLTKPIPVIFITAKVQKHEITNYLNLGVWGVITKPFDPLKLPGEIQNILNSNRIGQSVK